MFRNFNLINARVCVCIASGLDCQVLFIVVCRTESFNCELTSTEIFLLFVNII